MKVTKAQLIKRVRAVVEGAPPEVLEAAQSYIEALDDFSPRIKLDLSEAQVVWDDDLPTAYRGRYPLTSWMAS